MKRARASKIANEFANHAKWRSHGRSLKINDIEKIGLTIKSIDADNKLSDLVYRIQVVCRILFDKSSIYKMYVTEDYQLFKHAVAASSPASNIGDYVTIELECPNCTKPNNMYIEFNHNQSVENDIVKKGFRRLPANLKIICSECGSEIDVGGIKDKIERDTGKKIIL
jgi:dihydroorotate dehydrogenase